MTTRAEGPAALVDRSALARWLADHASLPATGIDVTTLSAGRSNLTFRIVAGERQFVLRRPPLGHIAPRSHDMSRESRIIRAMEGTGVPVPHLVGYSDDPAVAGAPFLVMDLVAGSVVDNVAAASRFTADQARALSEAVVEVLARIHAIPVDAPDVAWLGRPEGYLSRRLGRWRRQWEDNPHRDLAAVEEVFRILVDALPPEQPPAVVHGDFRLGNLLVSPDTARVTAVLDWELATRGDPLTDLAHCLIYWERTLSRRVDPSQDVRELPGFLPGDVLAELYAAASGRSVEHLRFYLALGHWRSAVIKEAIFQRHLRGETFEDQSAMGDAVESHLSEARELARSL